MTAITIERARLARPTDLADAIEIPVAAITDRVSRPTEVRRYSAGRLRAVTRSGTAKVLEIQTGLLAATARDRLEGWLGQVVLYRDHLGRKLYGVVGELPVTEHKGVSGTPLAATFSLQQVTYSEAV